MSNHNICCFNNKNVSKINFVKKGIRKWAMFEKVDRLPREAIAGWCEAQEYHVDRSEINIEQKQFSLIRL